MKNSRFLWMIFTVLATLSAYNFGLVELRAQKTPVMKLGDPMPINLFVELGKVVNPAVVNISTSQRVQMRRLPMGPGGGNPNDPFWQFFEEFMGPPDQAQRPAQALGTGFIVEDDGLIITNAHVISEADEVKVQMVGDKK